MRTRTLGKRLLRNCARRVKACTLLKIEGIGELKRACILYFGGFLKAVGNQPYWFGSLWGKLWILKKIAYWQKGKNMVNCNRTYILEVRLCF